MASPQAENGYLALANEIVEVLAKTQLSGHESRILWAVWRKTYSWHKKSDLISLSQLGRLTNLKRVDVCKSIKKLVSKRILLVDKNDDINRYEFNKNYDVWVLSKKTTSDEKRNLELSKKIHTKEDITKEILRSAKSHKNNKVKFPKEDYQIVIRKYCELKSLTLKKNEYLIPLREIKLMFQNGRSVQEIIMAMVEAHKREWPNWTLTAVRRRIAELLASSSQSNAFITLLDGTPLTKEEFQRLEKEKKLTWNLGEKKWQRISP